MIIIISFLLSVLEWFITLTSLCLFVLDEMKTFAGQQIEPLFQFSWLIVFLTLLLCGGLGLLLAFTVDAKLGIAVSLSLLAVLYIFFSKSYFIWILWGFLLFCRHALWFRKSTKYFCRKWEPFRPFPFVLHIVCKREFLKTRRNFCILTSFCYTYHSRF